MTFRGRVAPLRSTLRFIAMVAAARPRYAASVTLLRSAGAVVPMAMLYTSKLLIDELVYDIGRGQARWSHLGAIVGAQVVLTVLGDVLDRTARLFDGFLSDLTAKDLALRIMGHAAELNLSDLEDSNVRDMLQRARSHIDGSVNILLQVLALGQMAIALLSFAAVVVAIHPWLVLLLMAAVLPSFFGEAAHGRIAHQFMTRWTEQRRRLDYYLWVASEPNPAKELRVFRLWPYFTSLYRTLADEYLGERWRLNKARRTAGMWRTALATLVHYLAVIFVIGEALAGELSIGSVGFLIGSFQQCRTLLASMLTALARLYEESLQLSDLFDFLDLRPQQSDSARRRLAAARPSSLVFERVGFQYPGSDKWVIRDISFTVRAGGKIAFVGENGAGKTTIVKLLTRLYEPTEGRILLDGVDVREYDLESFWASIGIIFQDFCKYDLTVRDNIVAGDIAAPSDDAKIERVARASLAAEVIERLESRYDHMLGRRFLGGTELSGGEWQKIALARAYLSNAGLIVLDEPTAALDARAEDRIFRNFVRVADGKMAVMISHRLSTVRMADQIIVLRSGRIVEQGSHIELVDRGGHYAELFTLQAAGYR